VRYQTKARAFPLNPATSRRSRLARTRILISKNLFQVKPDFSRLTIIEQRGSCENEQPKIGLKGEEAGASEIMGAENGLF
jgi:hypothetical protein